MSHTMKQLFPGYYRPSEQEFVEMWKSGIFAFDANMLLNIYRYTPETQKSFFHVLERLKDRIWIPHQAALEFQVNRLEVISVQEKAYLAIESLFSEELRKLEAGLNSYRRHTYVDVSRLTESLQNEFERTKEGLRKVKAHHPDYFDSDPLRDKIEALFEGKIGGPYSNDKLDDLHKKAELRFTSSPPIPPGYKDAKKPSPQKYGDVVLWFQTLDFALETQRPILLITDDRKEDWWFVHEGKTVGPKPELVQEMHATAEVKFYMYHSDQFLEYAQKFLSITDQENAIEEAKEIRKQDEANSVALSELPYWGEAVWGEAYGTELAQLIAARRAAESLNSPAVEAARRAAEAFNTPAVEAARRTAEAFNTPAVEAARRTAEAFNTPAVEAARHAAEAFNTPAVEAARRTAEAFNTPAVEAARHAAEAFNTPAVEAARHAAEAFNTPAVEAARRTAEAFNTPAVEAARRAAVEHAQRLTSDPTYRRMIEEILKRK
jgi:hypothetical protein